jgi:putative glutamine amidotransferase
VVFFLVVGTGLPAALKTVSERRIRNHSEISCLGKGRPRPVPASLPLIGITPDIGNGRVRLSRAYEVAVSAAGGLPIALLPVQRNVAELLDRCDGVILSGGDDPIMETWGRPTHPQADKVDSDRQEFDVAVYQHAREMGMPVLGICLGMQIIGLESGAELNQHLPDSCPTAANHARGQLHPVSGSLGQGQVHSRHHQALRTPGRCDVVATADDGLIEAIRDSSAEFCLGVQWHPERSGAGALGSAIFEQFVSAAARYRGMHQESNHATE